ncbi:hypothetical protein SANTM175S_01671 [Streptomyces antimycoticus]
MSSPMFRSTGPDVFPQLMKEGKPIFGYVAEGYWEDMWAPTRAM